jgi:uncharacterized membrane protein
MSSSPFVRTEAGLDRTSDAPLAVDLDVPSNRSHLPAWASHLPAWASRLPAWASRLPAWAGRLPARASRLPASWLGMSSYLVAGAFLGLVLIVALSMARGGSSNKAAAGVVTDNVVHLQSAELAESCWRGAELGEPARVTVSLEIGLDGKVRNAVAAGESAAMRACVEAHVKAWEFLPQATSSQMVLPVEIATH